MGTRADFYVGIDPAYMRWVGSISYDGYPDGNPKEILSYFSNELNVRSEEKYLKLIDETLNRENIYSGPFHGWPWPWIDSSLTDYAYTYYKNEILVYHSKKYWHRADRFIDDDDSESLTDIPVLFPDMSKIQNVAHGDRSGFLIVQGILE